MIGKVPKAGRGFKGLVAYLLRGDKGTENNPNRVAWTEVRNLASDDPELASKLMHATARRNRRCEAPTYHFVISWAHDERPTEEMMRQVADTTCADIGLEDFQRLYVAHADTRHQHLHVVANRVHPETGKAWNRRQDWPRIERSLADQSRTLGLEHVPGRHNDPDDFKDEPKGSRNRSLHADRRKAAEELLCPWSADRIERERNGLTEIFDAAKSWEELDQALSERDMLLVRKGQGLVIADANGAMKLSALGKELSGKKLDERMGESRTSYVARLNVGLDSEPSARAAAFERAAEAGDALEFSFALHRLGLISRKELDRYAVARDTARAEAERTLPFRERLSREMARQVVKADKDQLGNAEPQKKRRDRDERER